MIFRLKLTGELVVLSDRADAEKPPLKMVNRLIEPTSGTVYVNGKDIKKEDPIQRRNIGYVIQNVGFSHMSIKENLEIIPRGREKNLKLRKQSACSSWLVGPDEYMYRFPSELSGSSKGQAWPGFFHDSDIILMDEPFSALIHYESSLQEELFNMQQELRKTIIRDPTWTSVQDCG